jgi:hypothetical protein
VDAWVNTGKGYSVGYEASDRVEGYSRDTPPSTRACMCSASREPGRFLISTSDATSLGPLRLLDDAPLAVCACQ